MAKSQKKSTREVRKPKANKVKAGVNGLQPVEKPGAVRGLDNMKNQ